MEQTTTTTVLSVDQVVETARAALIRMRSREVEVTPDTSLRDLGLDSLEVAEIFLDLEEVAGIELDQQSVMNPETVADLAQLKPL
jgi:acyl carrier protein